MDLRPAGAKYRVDELAGSDAAVHANVGDVDDGRGQLV